MASVLRIRDGRLEQRTVAGTWVYSYRKPEPHPAVLLARKLEHDRLAAVGYDDAFIREEIARQERYTLLTVPAGTWYA